MSVYTELAKHERIVAVKEASGNLSAIATIAAELSDTLAIYSGNDDQIVPIMSLGGRGVISVLSNVLPKETHDMCRFMLDGDVKSAAALQLKMLSLINALFIEVNPIPVKTACAMMGLASEEMRMPLCEMEEANRAKLVEAMRHNGLL
jgi:4-hydroxy-tetrahydrodipicolinate synthase